MSRINYQCTQCDHKFHKNLERPPAFMDTSWRRASCPECDCIAREEKELLTARITQEYRENWKPATPSAPGFIIKGVAKDAGHIPEHQRAVLPRWARKEGFTPETYERAHEANYHNEQAFAKQIKKERKRSGTPDGALTKLGSVPFTQYLGMKEKYPDEMADGSPPSREILERENCLYEHEK